jgi:hypothetical protein
MSIFADKLNQVYKDSEPIRTATNPTSELYDQAKVMRNEFKEAFSFPDSVNASVRLALTPEPTWGDSKAILRFDFKLGSGKYLDGHEVYSSIYQKKFPGLHYNVRVNYDPQVFLTDSHFKPVAFSDLTICKWYDHDQRRRISADFDGLTNLVQLRVNGNNWTEEEKLVQGLTSLVEVNLSPNELNVLLSSESFFNRLITRALFGQRSSGERYLLSLIGASRGTDQGNSPIYKATLNLKQFRSLRERQGDFWGVSTPSYQFPLGTDSDPNVTTMVLRDITKFFLQV